MSSGASKLVFTIGLIFLFTILFIYYNYPNLPEKGIPLIKCRSISSESMCVTELQIYSYSGLKDML
jgi:hypothetical protein